MRLRRRQVRLEGAAEEVVGDVGKRLSAKGRWLLSDLSQLKTLLSYAWLFSRGRTKEPIARSMVNCWLNSRPLRRGALLILAVVGVIACSAPVIEPQEGGAPDLASRSSVLAVSDGIDSWLLNEFVPSVLRGMGVIRASDVRRQLSDVGVIGEQQIDSVGRHTAQFDGSGTLSMACASGWIRVFSSSGVLTGFTWTSNDDYVLKAQSPEVIRSALAGSGTPAIALWNAKPESMQFYRAPGIDLELVASWSRVVGFSYASVSMIDGVATHTFHP